MGPTPVDAAISLATASLSESNLHELEKAAEAVLKEAAAEYGMGAVVGALAGLVAVTAGVAALASLGDGGAGVSQDELAARQAEMLSTAATMFRQKFPAG